MTISDLSQNQRRCLTFFLFIAFIMLIYGNGGFTKNTSEIGIYRIGTMRIINGRFQRYIIYDVYGINDGSPSMVTSNDPLLHTGQVCKMELIDRGGWNAKMIDKLISCEP